MDEKGNFALVPRPPSAVEKAESGAKRILDRIVADMLAMSPVVDAEMLFQKGCAYRDGAGVKQDYAKAVRLFREAAEQGHAGAQFMLGVSCHCGHGVKQDYEQAIHWYRKAAENGDAIAQNNLGCCFLRGEGVAKSPVEACKWFKLAAERGQSKAKEALASLSALMSSAELAESERLYKEFSKRQPH